MIFQHSLPDKLFGSFSFEGMNAKQFVHSLITEFTEHEVMTRSAAIAFYAMLAFVPFIAVLLTLSIQFLPELAALSFSGVDQQAIQELENWMKIAFPQSAYAVLDMQILRMQLAHSKTILSVGLLVSLWVASSVFIAAMDALNHIYGVGEKRRYWKRRMIAMAMTLVQSVLLMGSLVTIVAWPQILKLIGLGYFAALAATIVHFFGAFVIVLLSFALTFQIGPHAEQRTAWITPGSFFGSLVFLSITYLFRVYVQNFGSYDKVYGSLGGVVVLLMWFWMSAAVLLGAATINKILAKAKSAHG